MKDLYLKRVDGEMGLSDAEICKTLNLTRNRLNYLRRKIEVENVHGSVEF